MLWKKYEDARAKGGSEVALDDLLRDYYETKLAQNKPELDRKLKEILLEPAVHLSLKEAKAALPYTEYIQKAVFRRWLQSLEPLHFLKTPVNKLLAELRSFAEAYEKTALVDPMAPPPEETGGAPGGPRPPKKKPAPASR